MFQSALQRLDELVQEFDALPYPQIREKVFELLQVIDQVHRLPLTRLAAHLQREGEPDRLEQVAAQEPLVQTLLLLYDLLPLDERGQVELALGTIRPSLQQQGGEVELLEVERGVVHLRLGGSAGGCTASTIATRRLIEQALREGYPGFREIRLHERPSPASSFIPLDRLDQPVRQGTGPIFQSVGRVEEIPSGSMQHFVVDGTHVLVANVEGTLHAVRDQCPGGVAPLHLGTFSPPIIICPWHNEAFDVRTGRRADGLPGTPLERVPLIVADGTIRLAIHPSDGSGA